LIKKYDNYLIHYIIYSEQCSKSKLDFQWKVNKKTDEQLINVLHKMLDLNLLKGLFKKNKTLNKLSIKWESIFLQLKLF
jgi:arsenate reductase-like glutaredoxin family protein